MLGAVNLRELVDAWRADAARIRRYGAEPLAASLERCAADLADALAHDESELLSLREAAERCGYVADSLGRMIRTGRLVNYGSPRRPKVRASDLPRHPGPSHLRDTRRATAARVVASIGGDHQ